MPKLRDCGPYIHPSWLPRLLVGVDRCEWKIWFQAQHDGRSWTRIERDFDQVKFNIRHTELMRRCTEKLEALGFDVALGYHNEFRVRLQGATISGRPDLIAVLGGEALIVDAKAAQPSQAHQVQVMLYIMLLQRRATGTATPRCRGRSATARKTPWKCRGKMWTKSSEKWSKG